MPICPNCDHDKFELHNGLYYCEQCQMQTQELQEEEMEDAFLAVHTGLEIRQPRKPKETLEKETRDRGRPWQLHEGLSVLLREQVKALIKLGANPQLEDVALRVWALYLSKIKLAFCRETETPATYAVIGAKAKAKIERAAKAKKSKIERKYGEAILEINKKREWYQYMGTQDDPKPKGFLRQRAAMKKSFGQLPRSKREKQADMLTDELQSSIQGHHFYKGDNPLEETNKSMVTEKLMTIAEAERDRTGHYSEASKLRRLASSSPCFLSKKQVLVVCLLALQYTNNLVLPADLITLVESGEVPYTQMYSFFPPDMKVASDCAVFNVHLCTADELRQRTVQMIDFLRLSTFPIPDVHVIVSRYVVELKLPVELHGLVRELLQVVPVRKLMQTTLCPLSTPYMQFPHYSAIAMSYIIVVLKLLFGLDDTTERQLSQYAREIRATLPLSQPLFVWDEWVAVTEDRLATTATGRATAIQPSNARNAKQSVKRHVPHCIKTEVREALAKPFMKLLTSVLSGVAAAEPTVPREAPETSNGSPMQLCTSALENDFPDLISNEAALPKEQRESLQMPSESEKGSSSTAIKDFSTSSLWYVIEEDADLSRMQCHTERMSQCSDSCSSSGADSEEEDDHFGTPTRFSGQKLVRRERTQASEMQLVCSNERQLLKRLCLQREEARQSLQDALQKSLQCCPTETDPNVVQGSTSLPWPHKRYFSLTNQVRLNQFRTYPWLLQVCSDHIRTTTNEIHIWVRRLDQALFFGH